MTLNEFYTLVVEVEGTLKNRPLSYISAEESNIALASSHLTYGPRLEQVLDLKVPNCNEELNRMF